MNSNRPNVLTIAGFDPSGGAGLLADIKVFEAHKVYGMGICTAITFQNENEYLGTKWVTFNDIEKQLISIYKKHSFDYVKIGLVKNIKTLQEIISFILQQNNTAKIIWDPIIKASAGEVFHKTMENSQLSEIATKIHLVTPNINEINFLNTTPLAPEKKAIELSHLCAVLLKGGHQEGLYSEDNLFIKGIKTTFTMERIKNGEKHGSGCVLSSSILAHLANGETINNACAKAKAFTASFLMSSPKLLGFHNYQK